MPLRRRQTPDDMKKQLIIELKRMKVDIKEYEVDRCHRMFTPYEVDGWRYYPAIVRFTSWTARNSVWTARKESKWRFSPHLTPRREAILDEARTMVSTEGVIENIDFVFVDRNCTFQAKASNGKLHSFSTTEELYNVAAWASDPPFDILEPIEDTAEENAAPPSSSTAQHSDSHTNRPPYLLGPAAAAVGRGRPVNSPRRLLPSISSATTTAAATPPANTWATQPQRRSARLSNSQLSVDPLPTLSENFAALQSPDSPANSSTHTSPDGSPTKGFVVDQ